jgi:hypothetical protein
MLPSIEFVWKVFVSLFAIAVGILALYWVCASLLYLVVLAVDAEVGWAKKRGRVPRTDAIAKALIGVLALIVLSLVFRFSH